MDYLAAVRRNRPHTSHPSIVPNKIHFSGPYRHQEWSLPDTLMYYISMKPSSAKAYQKMIKTCKYFYSKNSIAVITSLYYHYNQPVAGSLNENISFNSNSYKLWLIHHFSCDPNAHNPPNLVSSIIPKFYRFNATQLTLLDQVLTYNEFLFITSHVFRICCSMVTGKNDDGSIVPLEKLVEALPKAGRLAFNVGPNVSTISSKTMTELLKIKHLSKINMFNITNIPESFDLDAFYAYSKDNKHTKFQLTFSALISDAYKKHLEEIIDEVLEDALREFKDKPVPFLLPRCYDRVPYISFPGLDREKQSNMRSFYKF